MKKKVLFIGGNRYGEDGPLLEFLAAYQLKGFDVEVISDSDRINYPTSTMGSFYDALKNKDIKFSVVSDINEFLLSGDVEKLTTIICINCKWIIKKAVIDRFSGSIFNYHNSALPEQRGAACHSWRLMQDNNFSRMTIHHVALGIDQGEIVSQQEVIYPPSSHNLKTSYQHLAKFEKQFFSDFVNGKRELIGQNENDSFYWPRLITGINSFIDWSWTGPEIVSFCAAFGAPFKGASSFLDGNLVYLLDAVVVDEDVYFHPFQAGLIYRKTEEFLFIATRQGGIRVSIQSDTEIVYRLGQRLVTPEENLFAARLNMPSVNL